MYVSISKLVEIITSNNLLYVSKFSRWEFEALCASPVRVFRLQVVGKTGEGMPRDPLKIA